MVSIRFARTDPEAVAEGVAPDDLDPTPQSLYFTSNNGPGTKTTIVPLGWMKTRELPPPSFSPSSDCFYSGNRSNNVVVENESSSPAAMTVASSGCAKGTCPREHHH